MNVVSRSSLYDSDVSIPSEDDEFVAPTFEFEEVEVTASPEHDSTPSVAESEAVEEGKKEDLGADEFFFPLFSTETAPSTTVSLKAPVVEEIKVERPEAYYFAKFTPEDRVRFEAVAVTGSDVIQSSLQPPSILLVQYEKRKVMDLAEHNAQVAREKKKNKKKRPGKRKREGLKACVERKKKRAAEAAAAAAAQRKRNARQQSSLPNNRLARKRGSGGEAKAAEPPKKRFVTE
ncbi:hypothetical protein DICA0_C08504 [Diutina catenulata]